MALAGASVFYAPPVPRAAPGEAQDSTRVELAVVVMSEPVAEPVAEPPPVEDILTTTDLLAEPVFTEVREPRPLSQTTPPPPPMPMPAVPPAPSPAPRDAEAPQRATAGSRQAVRPVLRRSPDPPYPAAARRANHEGTVLLRVHVDGEGRVREAVVLQSSGRADCDRAAADTVQRRWLFESTGREFTETVRVRFQLR